MTAGKDTSLNIGALSMADSGAGRIRGCRVEPDRRSKVVPARPKSKDNIMEDHLTTSRRFGPNSTITAFFDDRHAAMRAVERLTVAGVPSDAVLLTEGHRPGAAADDQSSVNRGFFDKLGDFFFPEEDRSAYAEGLSRGGYLVTASRLDADLYDTALDILDDDGAVDIDERSATWRAAGWTGNYTDLHDPEGLLRARSEQPGQTVQTARGHDRSGPGVSDRERWTDPVDGSVGTDDRADDRAGHPSPAAAGMAAAASGMLFGSQNASHAASEGPQSMTEGQSDEMVDGLRTGKRDTTHGRTRVRSYILEEDEELEDGDLTAPLTERDINRS